MTIIVGLDGLSKALIDAGKNLLSPPSTDELLTLLDETESLLRNVDQDPPLSMQSALMPSKSALVSVDLLSHPDSDVRVSVLSCLTEIVRITAPEAPYSDDRMKDIFRLTIEAFEKLADASSSRSYRKAVSVLDNVAKVKSCLVMLDLECYDLILLMFQKFLKIIRPAHPQVVFSSMEMIMITIIDEIEEVSTNLLHILLASVKKENQNVSPMSGSLAEKVLSRCARKLKPYIIEALNSTGTSLDMYSPVVSSICQSVFDTTEVHNVVNTKENEATETMLERRVTTSGSLEEKLGLGHSRKENLSKSSSKRPARDGTRRINEKDKFRNGNNSSLLKQSLKQLRSESTDAETELGITGKRGRKPNSLMNPEDYDISWLSGKRDPFKTSSNRKIQKKRSGGESSLGKVAARKTPLLKETSPATSRSLTGSLKRSRVKVDEIDYDYDSDSLSSPRLKKLASCFRDEEPPKKESNQEEDDRKIGNSSKKIRSQNGLQKSQKTAQKSPIVEAKILNSSGKRLSVRSDAKRKNLERASLDTLVPQSSKRKKMVSQVAARKSSDESEETPKSHPTRRRTARKEVESDTNGFGEDLVGKRVNIWWPLDKTFYEGVVDSYCTRKKMHRVIYSDGDSEELNLSEERWELLEDHIIDDEQDKEVDLPESIPLSDILQRQRVKKSKNVAVSVEPTSSSGVSRTLHMKKETGKKLKKQVEKSREGKNLRSLRELNAETDRTAEEEEVSLESESDRREEQEYEDDCSEKQEQSEHKGVEAEAKEEEKQFANPEIESESEDTESEEEPKWRETDDMDDEVEAEEEEEEAEEEEEEEEEDDEEEEEEEREEVDEKGANTSFSEIEKEEEEREEVDEKGASTSFSEIEKEEEEREEVDEKGASTSFSEIEKEEDEEKES